MQRIRTLVVDDEAPARRKVLRFLQRYEDFEIVGEARNGRQALDLIRSERPDAVFLDIQMPGLDGFGVIEKLQAEKSLPWVVFVTAYDDYAIRAFEVQALDYLLKPFDENRFDQTIRRLRNSIRADEDVREGFERLLRHVATGDGRLSRVTVRNRNRLTLVDTSDIDWIAAAGNYVKLHAGGKSHLLRESLAGLEARLDPRRFARIHRSTVVNVERIHKIHPWSHNDYQIVLKDGTELRLSRRYRENLFGLLG